MLHMPVWLHVFFHLEWWYLLVFWLAVPIWFHNELNYFLQVTTENEKWLFRYMVPSTGNCLTVQSPKQNSLICPSCWLLLLLPRLKDGVSQTFDVFFMNKLEEYGIPIDWIPGGGQLDDFYFIFATRFISKKTSYQSSTQGTKPKERKCKDPIFTVNLNHINKMLTTYILCDSWCAVTKCTSSIWIV